MWYINNPSGSAHTVLEDGTRATVRRHPDAHESPEWIIMMDGVRNAIFPSYETRDEAMRHVEIWMQLRNKEPR